MIMVVKIQLLSLRSSDEIIAMGSSFVVISGLEQNNDDG